MSKTCVCTIRISVQNWPTQHQGCLNNLTHNKVIFNFLSSKSRFIGVCMLSI